MEVAMPLVVGALVTCAVGAMLASTVPGRRGGTVGLAGAPNTGILARWAYALAAWMPERLAHAEALRAVAREAYAVASALPGWGADASSPEGVPSRETLRMGFGALMMGSGVGAALGAVVALSPWGAMVGFAFPAAWCAAAAGRHRHDERRRIEAAMPEAFRALAISLGSGHSLTQAMRFVGSHAEEPVRTAFLRVAFSMTCGISAHEALDDMLERLPAPGLELVSLALTVSQRTGAPLKDLLADAANTVGERIELTRRLDVKTSQARMSARMVALMPIAMICLLTLFSQDFRSGIATFTGMFSLVVAAALNICAWLIIRRIMKVKI